MSNTFLISRESKSPFRGCPPIPWQAKDENKIYSPANLVWHLSVQDESHLILVNIVGDKVIQAGGKIFHQQLQIWINQQNN